MNGYEIAFTGLPRQYQTLKSELLEATDKVLSSGRVLDGNCTELFENQIAVRCNREYAIAVNSCSQALIMSQMALGIDGKVLIPSTSFVATLNSVVMAGNVPIFCDTDDRALLDIDSYDGNLKQDGVNAVMYVNMFGNILDYNRLKTATKFFGDQDVAIIEDAAQSFGASINGVPSGKLGDISVLSFDPTKNLPNYGSGGMILTDDPDIASLCYNLRDNGKLSNHSCVGTNSKISEVDSAHLLIKLKYFDAWQKRRAEIAEFYNEYLIPYVDPILPNKGVKHAWHKYVIRVHGRDNLKTYLESKGIETKVHYPVPLFEHDVAFNYYHYAHDIFKNATTHAKEALSLPIYPEMTDAEVEAVVENIIEYYAGD